MESYINPSDPWVETVDGREVQFYRADGRMVCESCDQQYYAHPFEETVLGYDDRPFLRRVCNGDLVKL